jgi:hypothetical protein
MFDLPAYVVARLKAMELDAVDSSSACTYAHAERYFSFRRTTHRGETVYGRNLSAVMLT